MKKVIILVCFVFSMGFSQETVSSTIILPDVKIVLEGDTSIPLQEQTNIVLGTQEIDFGRVDLAELSRLRRSEYYKVELTNQRRSSSFSLSSFRLFYGTSENLFSDITIGKRVDKLNYLVSYLRNSRGSLVLSNDRLYNTELKLDDINVDFIVTISSQLELQTEVGYYARELGLYTNTWSLSEQLKYFPAKVGFSFIPGAYSLITFAIEGDYLERNNKLLVTGYTNQVFYHFSPSLVYEANWTKDNFLRLEGRYFYLFQDVLFHEGEIGFLDRLNVLSFLSLDIGTKVYISSRDPFFWYPLFLIRYRHKDTFVFFAGVDGERKRLLSKDLLEENQYIFTSAGRYDRWTPQIGLQYIPQDDFSLKGTIFYHFYSSYALPVYIASVDMFTHQQTTNISLLTGELSLDWSPTKDVLWKNMLSYTLPLSPHVYEVGGVSLSSLLEWKWQAIGLTTMLKGTYYPRMRVASGVELPDAIIVNTSFSQQIGKDFYLELSFENLFNQNYFRRPCIPGGGLQVVGGLRILL